MVKQETNIESQQAQQQPTARERYRSRYSEAHPDLNLDDEDAFYGQANANLDELEGFRKANKELGEAFDRTPILAGIVLAAREGQNPFVYLAENIGPDMDIRELVNNPEFGQQMGEALTKWQERQEKARKADETNKKEIGENVAKSFETLKEIQQERGLSNEDCAKMAKDFFGKLDEEGKPVGKESFMYLAGKGIVTKGMWQALFDARSHDKDVADAAEKARTTALNEKVQNGLKSFGTGLPPSMPTGGAGRGEGKSGKKKGGFASFGEDM